MSRRKKRIEPQCVERASVTALPAVSHTRRPTAFRVYIACLISNTMQRSVRPPEMAPTRRAIAQAPPMDLRQTRTSLQTADVGSPFSSRVFARVIYGQTWFQIIPLTTKHAIGPQSKKTRAMVTQPTVPISSICAINMDPSAEGVSCREPGALGRKRDLQTGHLRSFPNSVTGMDNRALQREHRTIDIATGFEASASSPILNRSDTFLSLSIVTVRTPETDLTVAPSWRGSAETARNRDLHFGQRFIFMRRSGGTVVSAPQWEHFVLTGRGRSSSGTRDAGILPSAGWSRFRSDRRVPQLEQNRSPSSMGCPQEGQKFIFCFRVVVAGLSGSSAV